MIWGIGRESGTRTGSAGECTKNAFPAKEETPACGGDERGKEKRARKSHPTAKLRKPNDRVINLIVFKNSRNSKFQTSFQI